MLQGPRVAHMVALRLLGRRDGRRACLQPPAPRQGWAFLDTTLSPACCVPQFCFLVGEGTLTDINSVKSAHPCPQERSPGLLFPWQQPRQCGAELQESCAAPSHH